MGKLKLILAASILLLVSAQVNANPIVNGGFEEPFGIDTYIHRNGSELTGWTLFSEL